MQKYVLLPRKNERLKTFDSLRAQSFSWGRIKEIRGRNVVVLNQNIVDVYSFIPVWLQVLFLNLTTYGKILAKIVSI